MFGLWLEFELEENLPKNIRGEQYPTESDEDSVGFLSGENVLQTKDFIPHLFRIILIDPFHNDFLVRI